MSSNSGEPKGGGDDISRLLLLLTDILGDLNVVQPDSNKVLWTPETVQQALVDDDQSGGMDLVAQLLNQLRVVGGDESKTTPTITLQSWKELHDRHPSSCPPWVTAKDLSENPLISKLEILCFFASRLQSCLLAKPKKKATAERSVATNTSSDGTVSNSSVSDLLSLPSHMTKEQREIIMECYHGLKEDYDKRRIGMKQRLDILLSNFEADNQDDKEIMDLKAKLQNLSFSSSHHHPALADLSDEDLFQHFTTPHSRYDGTKPAIATPLEHFSVIDRGGRTDEVASRVRMPEWSSK